MERKFNIQRQKKAYSNPETNRLGIGSVIARIEQTFLDVGSTIGKYTVLEEIDHGGMAVVYKALQLDLDREVALKVMPAQINIAPQFLDRFLSEAHAVARLSHPNIVNIHEVATESNLYFLVMDYIPGKNLYFYLNQEKPKLVDVVDIVIALTDALNYAHEQKIVHRDLKLNNVIMRDNRSPVLIDFGLAKTMEDDKSPSITRTGEIVGSPAYMAPERVVGGKSDHRADICSMGIMLYEMLTFKNPYLDQRSIPQTTANVVEANPISPKKLVAWIPPELEAITLKAMAADPDKRYQSMEEFRDDLIRFKKGDPVHAQPPSIRLQAKHFIKKHWAPGTIIILIMLFATLSGISFYIQQQKAKSPWYPVFQERFNRKNIGETWEIAPSSHTGDSGAWFVDLGHLQTTEKTGSYIRLNRPLTGDMRISLDIGSNSEELYNCGIFFNALSPENGYAFHIHHNGKNNHGLTFPNSDYLFSNYNRLDFPASNHYHVEIERTGTEIICKLNGIEIVRRHDFCPPIGTSNRMMGFFAQGNECYFDNVKIYQRATPQIPSPRLIADRFWERGDFETALEEYRTLNMSIPEQSQREDFLLRIPSCLIRLKRFQDAYTELMSPPFVRSRNPVFIARRNFILAHLYAENGQSATSDSILTELLYPHIPREILESTINKIAIKVASLIDQNKLKEAEDFLSRILGPEKYRSDLLGNLHLRVMTGFREKGALSRSGTIGKKISAAYQRNPEVHSRALTELGRVYLCKAQKEKAIEILNQCIATHIFTPSVWDAWMLLGTIYEYDNNFNDAMTIYKKVYRECPKTMQTPWMARLKTGCLADKATTGDFAHTAFEDIVYGVHPYPLPRMIARYYLGDLAENDFLDNWDYFYPNDKTYLHFFAQKAVLEKEYIVAQIYLHELKQFLPQSSWRYAQVYKMQNDLTELGK